MSANPDRLFDLLPQIIQIRDAEQDWPLRALLRVIAQQVQIVEDDITLLYENWFIETCQDWVVPYIGALVGYEPVQDTAATRSQVRDKVLIPRREVANTIRYRRRKGTLALLEALGRDVSGWPAVVAVEFYKRLADFENLRYPDGSIDLLDLGKNNLPGALGPGFDTSPLSLQIHQSELGDAIGSLGVGLFVWRLRTYPVSGCLARRMDENQPEYYSFSVLGNDTPLYTHVVEGSEARAAGEVDPFHLPIPISRQALEDDLNAYLADRESYRSHYYGKDKSFCLEVDGWPNQTDEGIVGYDSLVVADLSGLEIDNVPYYTVERDKIAVDPVLGRILFAPNQSPHRSSKNRDQMSVSYYYGFSADIGGGEYDRTLSPRPSDAAAPIPCAELGDMLTQWVDQPERPTHTLIELNDSGVYESRLPDIELLSGQSLHIRAANRCRPVILIGDWHVNAPEGLTVIAHPGSCLILDGLLIAGRGLRVIAPESNRDEMDEADAAPVNIIIRHSTLVPGWMLRHNCDPRYGQGASIELVNVRARLHIDRSIVGSISVAQTHCDLEPSDITITDSILDSTAPEELALYGENSGPAYATLTIRRSTVIGGVLAREMPLGENTIFSDAVKIERRQRGCMRYCYVAPGSRTPRRFRCQPDLGMQRAEENLRAAYEADYRQAIQDNVNPLPPQLPPQDEIDAVRQSAQEQIYPYFESVRYGKPTYCQLAPGCPIEIARGAQAEGEMGVFYHLFNPQREANLRARLEEYTPASASISLIYAN